ncbi:hypothetical protein RIF25_08605 [Thermosynechococcaceae cyanobacterium BACA0444]|uniref:Uncharacterized protein n=1 Tax=Pseudocalidococcus azoricus BACA0444 TaxID=2918990 RepID=A0AAE4FSV6_9CYAN|nr:hypothetical protein [Pseudocalidococcus azoricus]MDS3860874.1 hypothetical protein [Pseudocalidococcus azoricus BACA0444]
MNYTTIFLRIKPLGEAWLYRPWVVLGLAGLFWATGLEVNAQVFSSGQLIPTLISIPDYTSPNSLIPPLIPQLIPTLPGDTTCSPFQRNLSQCLNQYRNTTIPEPVLRSILPRNPAPPSDMPTPAPNPAPQVVTAPPPLPAPGTVTEANCPPNTALVLLPGGYACMQTPN